MSGDIIRTPSDNNNPDDKPFDTIASDTPSFDILTKGSVEATETVPDPSESEELDEFDAMVDRADELKDEQSELLRQDSSKFSYDYFLTPGSVIPTDRNEKKQFLRDPDNWTRERLAVQEAGIRRQFEEALRASERIRSAEREKGIGPTIYAFRGISGSGKTFACQNNPDLIPGILDPATAIDGKKPEPTGVLATDSSKVDLWAKGVATQQIHEESSAMYQRLKKRIDQAVERSYDPETGIYDFSEVRDRTMSDKEDVQELIKDALQTHRRIAVADLDIPFEVSAARVLSREKDSPEPNPSSTWLNGTYVDVRNNRRAAINQLLEAANEQGIEVQYTLFAYDYDSDPKELQRKIAEIVKNPNSGKYELVVLEGCEELFERVAGHEDSRDADSAVRTTEVRDAAAEEANRGVDTPITAEYVDYFIARYFNSDETSQKIAGKMRKVLESHIGRTLGEALDSMNQLS